MRDKSGEEVADALGQVCSDAAGIRQVLELAGEASALDRLIAAVRQGGEVAERLDELHTALQRSGDARGAPAGAAPRERGYGSAQPVSVRPRLVEVVFLCPDGSCSRIWRPGPASESSARPRCDLRDKLLRWERL